MSPLMVLTVTVWSALNWPFQWKFLVSSARAKDERARRELNAREEQRMRMGAFMRKHLLTVRVRRGRWMEVSGGIARNRRDRNVIAVIGKAKKKCRGSSARRDR